MTRVPLIVTLLLSLLVTSGSLLAQQRPALIIGPLSEEGDVEASLDTEVIRFTNGFRVVYGDAVLTAWSGDVNRKTGDVEAEGHVNIQMGEHLWVGEHVHYNFNTRMLEAQQFRTGQWPVFGAGEGLNGPLTKLTNNVYTATNSFITPDDISTPAIRIKAKSIKIILNDRIEARSATLYLGDVPVFYFPYYSRRLGENQSNFYFIPGYRSSYGAYILGSYTWYLDQHLDGMMHVDYRTRRGFGVGPDANIHLGRWGDGILKYYYMHDEDPNASGEGQTTPDNRQRVYFAYQATPWTNLNIKAMVRYQGDTNIVREFFEREYRQNVQPSTYFEVNKFWQNFSLDTYVQPRVNNFLDTVERLPDIKLTGFRQQIGASPLYYESESSAGYYNRLFPDTNGAPAGLNYSAGRADTYHQILMPETFFGWLNFTPRVGGRFTYYSQSSGPGGTNDEAYRGVFNTGAELSFKASKVWPGIESRALEVDGLRHIIQPSLNYVYVPAPNYLPPRLPQFDYELPSLRLLPINFPDYNSIDSIDSQNVIRFGLFNKLQTKRHGEVVNLVNWDVYSDWRLRPNSTQTTFSDLYSDLAFRPRSWITLESMIRYDIFDNDLRMALHTLTLHPNDVWSWSLGQYYLRDDFSSSPTALGEGNNLFSSDLFFRVNENWGLRAMHRFNVRTGRMEEQDYTVYRDLRSWTAALTFRIRNTNNSGGPDDYTVAFTFSLKAFPRYGIGSETRGQHSLFGS